LKLAKECSAAQHSTGGVFQTIGLNTARLTASPLLVIVAGLERKSSS